MAPCAHSEERAAVPGMTVPGKTVPGIPVPGMTVPVRGLAAMLG
jgi:hypothetical protein